LKPLHRILPGEKAYIIDMRNPRLCILFFEMGVFPGDLVEVRENIAEKCSLIVHINNRSYTIYKKEAETILTNKVSLEVCLN
jgi:Fe2+ transport system protein FeoA